MEGTLDKVERLSPRGSYLGNGKATLMLIFLPSIIEDNDVSRRVKILKTIGHGRPPYLGTVNCSCIKTVEAPRSYKIVNNVKE